MNHKICGWFCVICGVVFLSDFPNQEMMQLFFEKYDGFYISKNYLIYWIHHLAIIGMSCTPIFGELISRSKVIIALNYMIMVIGLFIVYRMHINNISIVELQSISITNSYVYWLYHIIPVAIIVYGILLLTRYKRTESHTF
ncbi:MAG: hypothetical protein GY828_04170 [Candidatus Gracilibacteria bacterium]|nr:hypothetical protein [Candidatus Gracilibacteria bacterium]